MKNLFSLLLLFLFTSPGISQPYYFRHFEVEDGISNNSVINCLQDKKGFLWFGTPDGLNRYDGKSFKTFKNYGKPGDLLSNAIYYLHEDLKGTLWVGTEKGLFQFDEKHQQFHLINFTSGKTIRAIQSDDNDGIWIALESGIYIYQPGDHSTKYFSYDFLKGATSLAKSEDGLIWVGCRENKLASYDYRKNHFKIYKAITGSRLSTIEKILPIKDKNLLIGTSFNGLQKFNGTTGEFSQIQLGTADRERLFIHDILQAPSNEYWVASENGLFIYNDTTKKVIVLKKDKRNPYSISDNAVYSIGKDKEGGIWAGTYFGGINYYSNPQILFEKIISGPGENPISGNVIRQITKDKYGKLWIGTEDAGIIKLDPVTGNFENLSNLKFRIPSTNIHGLLADGDDLFIGTFEHGLYIVNYRTGALKAHFEAADSSNLKSNYINTILKRSVNEILIGTSYGLYSYDIQKRRLKSFPALPENQFYSAIAIDSNKTVWLGTHSQGVFLIDSNNQVKKVVIRLNKTGDDVLKETRILNLYFDNAENVWISTEDGLYASNLKTGKTRHYTYTSGLPSNIVHSVIQGKRNNYWIATSKGLVRIDNPTSKIKIFKKSDGLLTEQFNHHSSFIDDNGLIYFGSVKGLIRFDPMKYRESDFVAPIYATSITLFSKEKEAKREEERNQNSLLESGKINLPYQYASFIIAFSVLSFKSPDQIDFAYTLEPVDQSWNYIGHNTDVNFTNLSPGNYRLKVKSSNSSGLWLPNEKIVNIIITPPFWRSRPAYALYILQAITAFLFALYNIIRRNKLKQNERMEAFALKKEKELYEAKIDFYTNVAHEIKTPLSLIKAPLEKIRMNTHPTPLVSKYMDILNKNAERLLELSAQLLDLRKFEADHYHLNFDKINIVELLQNLFTNFQNLADDKQIVYTIESTDTDLFVNADEEALKKIFSNLLDNAIKYSNHLVCIIITKSDENMVEVKFINDGDLIPQDERLRIFEPFYRSKINNKIAGSGIGLSLVKSLSQLNQANIMYDIEQNRNCFIFSIPEF